MQQSFPYIITLRLTKLKYLECEKIKLLLFVQDFKSIYCSSEKLQKH